MARQNKKVMDKVSVFAPSQISIFVPPLTPLHVPQANMAENMETQFTVDQVATNPVACERTGSCGKIIHPGEPRLYVASRGQQEIGKYVCLACYNHYKQSPATTVCEYSMCNLKGLDRDHSTGSSGVTTRARPDVQEIRKSVNASQRQVGE